MLLHVLLNFPQSMEVRYQYGDVVVVACSTVVVLVVSRILSIVYVVFAVEFVM